MACGTPVVQLCAPIYYADESELVTLEIVRLGSAEQIFEIFENLIATFMQSCHAGLQNVKYGIGAEILVILHFSRNPRFGVVQKNSASYGNPLDEIYRSR